MEKNDHKELETKALEERMDRKIAEAKLGVAEKRLQFVLWFGGIFLAAFGVILPLFQTSKIDDAIKEMRQEFNQTSQNIRTESSSNRDFLSNEMHNARADFRAEMDSQNRQLDNSGARVDNAVIDMQKQFKEFAGTQLRNPVLECYVGGSSLEGATIRFSKNNYKMNEGLSITVKNTGDAPAIPAKLSIYTNIFIGYESSIWSFNGPSDDPNFAYLLEHTFSWPLDPKESRAIGFGGFVRDENLKTGNYPVVLKVYYGQPEPKSYRFTINVTE